jgi:Xaa-Pro aminopeptidase
MTQDRFTSRRRQLLDRLGDTVAIVPAGREQTRNDDVTHSFRQDSDFFFLTGFTEPDAVAVFDPGSDSPYVLFVRPRDPEMEAWNGLRAGTEGALSRHGADESYDISDLEQWLKRRLIGRRSVGYTLGGSLDPTVLGAISTARDAGERLGSEWPDHIVDVRSLLSEMRLIKSDDEIEALREACRISSIAHIEAMQFAAPGRTERQVQGVLEYVFSAHDAERIGYGSIVAGGDNAVILHYVENDRPLTGGDLLLIDAGAEYRHLTADITRTFPVDGTFTAPQRAVYDVVLTAMRNVIALCRPGLPFTDMHRTAVETLSEGMVDLGLLPGPVDEAVAKGWYRQFFFHGTGHWLGSDVHDAGAYRIAGVGRPLEPRMAFTVEPGIYVSRDKATVTLSHAPYDPDEMLRATFELGSAAAKAARERAMDDAGRFEHTVPEEFLGIGVRIEDDILITDDGHENLTSLVPVDPDAIEAVCAEESSLPVFT